jgi:hypothetical protein
MNLQRGLKDARNSILQFQTFTLDPIITQDSVARFDTLSCLSINFTETGECHGPLTDEEKNEFTRGNTSRRIKGEVHAILHEW